MTDLEDARLQWLRERPLYDDFASILLSRIRVILKPLGIWTDIQFRTKDLDSLLKKLMRGKHTYDSLPDKVGLRIVVLYRRDVETVTDAITGALHCGQPDKKTPATNAVGYLSTHIDWVRLPNSDPEFGRFVVTRFWAELQVRTQAQHLWSEMSHDGFYKNDVTISVLSDDVVRRVNLMAGQIEVADREFDRLRNEVPALEEAQLFHFLEPLYYRLTSKSPDAELSLQVLKILLPLFARSLEEVEALLSTFFDDRKVFFIELYRQVQESEDINRSPLFFQPEAIALYERILFDELELRKAWNLHFPESILEEFANEMGRSFD